MPKKKETGWGKVAIWYDSLLDMAGTYQKELILPNLIRLLSLGRQDKVLDIACGQGFFTHEFAKSCGEIVGVDISAELIKIAKSAASPKEKYFVLSADKMAEEIKPNYFDKAVIVLALQNIENLNGALAQASRALKTGGQLFLVLNHPCFRNPQKSAWDFDTKRGIQYRRVDEYLSESCTEIDMNPGKMKSEKTISFHRPMQTYFKALTKNGFLISRLEEWNSHKKSENGPRQAAEDKARKEIPLFLLIESLKS